MTLEETIPLMQSDDWKDRFKAEYWQLKIRLESLITLIQEVEAKRKPLPSKTPLSVYAAQATFMDSYMLWLNKRASKEGIDLYGK